MNHHTFGNAIIKEPDLEKKGLYCSKCEDIFWNHRDCDSIKENGVCKNCYKGVDLL